MNVDPLPPQIPSCEMRTRRFRFDELAAAPLQVDAVYQGGSFGDVRDDPIGQLLPVGNQGGFRYKTAGGMTRLLLAVLYTDLADTDWPDVLDLEQGRFVYYGDNKRPGHELHDTTRRGNSILRRAFENLHARPDRRATVPPFFIFSKADLGRDVVFRGLAVPGAPGVPPTDDLVAVWRTARGQRFQNYRSTFSILDVRVVERAWIEELLAGQFDGPSAPDPWRAWVRKGRYRVLRAPVTRTYRAPDEQLPVTSEDRALVEILYRYFDDPYTFEGCAARLWEMLTPGTDYEVTRRSRDGGRDAVGRLRLGPLTDAIKLDFALEAKRYALTTGVGVKEVSRLISRLRHRQFGVLVTTSYLAPQAYEEIRADEHPVVVVAARDIVDILRRYDLGTPDSLQEWLHSEFPRPTTIARPPEASESIPLLAAREAPGGYGVAEPGQDADAPDIGTEGNEGSAPDERGVGRRRGRVSPLGEPARSAPPASLPLDLADDVSVVGVDGARAGWVAVELHGRTPSPPSSFRSFGEVLRAYPAAKVVAVDIPIGMPVLGGPARRADGAARAFVGLRRSSVFPTPPRELLEAPSYAESRARALAVKARSLSSQAYALGPKILEVDQLATSDDRVYEVHPEVSFRAMKGSDLHHRKLDSAGFAERLQLLWEQGLSLPHLIPRLTGVSPEDVLDATAAAWSAARIARGLANTLPTDANSAGVSGPAIWY